MTFYKLDKRITLYADLNHDNLFKLFRFCIIKGLTITCDRNDYVLSKGNITWRFRDSTTDKCPARYVKTTEEIIERK